MPLPRILPVVAWMLASLPAEAQSGQPGETQLCRIYGSIGSAVASFMLPQSLEDTLALALGKNPELAAAFAASLSNDLKPSDKEALKSLDQADAAYLAEHAAQTGFELLLAAEADSPRSLRDRMTALCLERGAQTLINEIHLSKQGD